MPAELETTSSAVVGLPESPLVRLSVGQYHAMLDAGILGDDNSVELLEGLLVAKVSKRPAHSVATRLTDQSLTRAVPAGWHVRSQEPITTSESEPEPDTMVARGGVRDYSDRHPTAADVALAVEVAEISLEQDRGLKLRIYARARVPFYWIVNLVDRSLEVYSQPSGPTAAPGYGRRQDYGPGDKAPLEIEGQVVGEIEVNDLLPD